MHIFQICDVCFQHLSNTSDKVQCELNSATDISDKVVCESNSVANISDKVVCKSTSTAVQNMRYDEEFEYLRTTYQDNGEFEIKNQNCQKIWIENIHMDTDIK